MTKSLNFLAILCLMATLTSCTLENAKDAADSQLQAKPTRTITGVVEAIQNGKDGYTATIATLSKETYLALVSIVNLGGPDNYVRFELGNEVVLKGDYWNADGENHLTVKKIIKHSTVPDEYCWLSAGSTDLYQEYTTSNNSLTRATYA